MCADPFGNETNGCDYFVNETQNCSVQERTEKILITEVFYDTPGNDANEEWLKIFNPTNFSINLTGWRIEDNDNSWSFPENTNLNNMTYAIVARDALGFYALYNCSPTFAGFTRSLNNDGDELYLFNTTGVMDFVAWENGYNNTFENWTINASKGFSISRTSFIDTDSPSDWLSNQIPTPACMT